MLSIQCRHTHIVYDLVWSSIATRRGDIYSVAIAVLSWFNGCQLVNNVKLHMRIEEGCGTMQFSSTSDTFFSCPAVLFQMRFWRIAFIYSPVAPTVTSITMLSLLLDNLKNKLRPISRCTENQTEMVNGKLFMYCWWWWPICGYHTTYRRKCILYDSTLYVSLNLHAIKNVQFSLPLKI